MAQRAKASGNLGMPVGQRIADMAPERGRRIRNLRGELVVGAGDVLPKVEAGDICPPALPARVSDVTEDAGELAKASRRRSSALAVA